MKNLKTFWGDFVDIIFPRCCEACDNGLVGNEETMCTTCRISLPRNATDSIFSDSLKYKFINMPEVTATFAFLVFTKKGKVQKLLHALKYKGRQEVGTVLGFMFGQELLAAGNLPKADLIISVPLHKKKMMSRGYNQSDLLAEGFSKATGIAWNGSALQRVRYTATQTGKSKKERRENVEGVFVVKEKIDKKRIILIDDVLTTGATLEACVEALLAEGCEEFYIMTIAVAQH